jgi:adenosylcobinamide-GDP ribazoletransferase
LFQQLFNDFITGLQFLTRIRLVTQVDCSQDSFRRSVKFFPIIGCLIGLLLSGIIYGLQLLGSGKIPSHVIACSLILIEILLTGALHCDGFMDTMDGIFSGRSRERMLEIMKDSRVGSFGVIAFCVFALMKYSFILDMDSSLLALAFLVMPIVGRLAIVMAVTLFPYARREGLGKSFSYHADRRTLYIAGLSAGVILALLGRLALLSGLFGLIFAYIFAEYVNKRLEGLTGDIYGAVNELTELAVLFVFTCL